MDKEAMSQSGARVLIIRRGAQDGDGRNYPLKRTKHFNLRLTPGGDEL